jgi:hypothetical protein
VARTPRSPEVLLPPATSYGMNRPKLFLDTNVCIDVASGRICSAEWRRVHKYIDTHYRYYISFITWKELLIKLNRGSDEYFQQNKEPLQVLFRPTKRRVLPYPFVFAVRTILGINVARTYNSNLTEEEVVEATFRAVIGAPNKTGLRDGIRVPHSKKLTRFDLVDFDTQENTPQNEFAEILQGIREGATDDEAERKKWAAWILRPWGLTPYTDDCEKLAVGLDAAYCYTVSLSELAKDKAYDFNTHASNWGDASQLLYLCDEWMHFLTQDADFRNRTKNSPQSSQILTYGELVRSMAESVAPPT